MTQDQYGQPGGPGDVVRGDAVPEDEADQTAEQSRPMTRFQKVASALLGDRQDRDEAAQDEAAQDEAARATTGNRAAAGAPAVTGAQAATGSDVTAPDPGTPGGRPTWTPVSNADEAAAASSPGAQDASVTRPDGPAAHDAPVTRPDGPATQPDGPGTRAGEPAARAGVPHDDYWDDPGEPASGQDVPVAVTSPDVPVTDTDTDADPLARRDETAGQAGADAEDHPAAQQDPYGAARPGSGAAQAPAQDAPDAATIADVPASGTEAGTAGTMADQAGTMADRAGATAGPAAGLTAGAGASTGTGAGTAGATTGRHAAGPADGEAESEARPGALGDFSDLTYGNLIPDADQFIAQWQQIQFRFVDDPHGSVTEAADVVAQVTAKLEAAIAERQRAIEERQRAIQEQQRSLRGRWGEGMNADTEVLRETLRMYHTFLQQLIGSTTS